MPTPERIAEIEQSLSRKLPTPDITLPTEDVNDLLLAVTGYRAALRSILEDNSIGMREALRIDNAAQRAEEYRIVCCHTERIANCALKGD